MAQSRARATKVMRREFRNSNLSRIVLNDMPDDLLRHFVAPHRTVPTNAAKHSAIGDAGRPQPVVDGRLQPVRHGDRPDMATFADKIDDGPVVFAPLKMVHAKLRQFAAAESTTQ